MESLAVDLTTVVRAPREDARAAAMRAVGETRDLGAGGHLAASMSDDRLCRLERNPRRPIHRSTEMAELHGPDHLEAITTGDIAAEAERGIGGGVGPSAPRLRLPPRIFSER